MPTVAWDTAAAACSHDPANPPVRSHGATAARCASTKCSVAIRANRAVKPTTIVLPMPSVPAPARSSAAGTPRRLSASLVVATIPSVPPANSARTEAVWSDVERIRIARPAASAHRIPFRCGRAMRALPVYPANNAAALRALMSSFRCPPAPFALPAEARTRRSKVADGTSKTMSSREPPARTATTA